MCSLRHCHCTQDEKNLYIYIRNKKEKIYFAIVEHFPTRVLRPRFGTTALVDICRVCNGDGGGTRVRPWSVSVA